MRLSHLEEGALAGHYRVLRRAKAEGKSKAEAHEIAKKRGAHPNTVEDVYRDEVNEARWKQTSMSAAEAIKKYGKENVKVKKGALRNGDDMVEVFVENQPGSIAHQINWGGKNKPAGNKKPGMIKKAIGTIAKLFDEEQLNELTPEEEERHKDNPAMLKALRQIEKTFGPERKKISDQIMAMSRTVTMLQDPRWKDRAWSNVEQYGINNVEQLKQELHLMLKNEKAVDDDEITDVDTNIRQIERDIEKLSNLEEGGKPGTWCAICGGHPCHCPEDTPAPAMDAEPVIETEVGMSAENIGNILISMQHDISSGKLMDAHREKLIQQHNEIMEVYEKLASGELTEAELMEVLPLAALAAHGARMAAGAALRTAAGQAVRRGAIQGLKRAGSGIRNIFRRGNRSRSRRDIPDVGGGSPAKRDFGKLDLGRRGGNNLSVAGLKGGLSSQDLDMLRGK